MKTIAEALAETMALFEPTAPVSSGAAHGLFLSRELRASVEVPPFDASLVDGYAVRAADVTAGTRLRVVGESRAGGPTPLAVAPGTTTRIFTGAPVPKSGADAVVMQERVTRDGDEAVFEGAVNVGAGIRPRASDIARGDVLLAEGARVDAGAVALAASQGAGGLPVRRRPRVGIVTTGDELVTLEARRAQMRPTVLDGVPSLVYGTIHDANGPMLSALVDEAGAERSVLLHARDELDATKAAIESAWNASDVVLVAGGVSVGDHDLVHAALAALGVERTLWKVRMKPGKPLAVGVKGRVPIVGLPGNPVSAWVGFEVFVRPGLRRMLGDPRPYRRLVDVVLGAPVRCSADRTELARARLDDDGVAWPAAHQGSSALGSATSIDALLVLPEREGELAAGDRVRALLLQGRGASTSPFV